MCLVAMRFQRQKHQANGGAVTLERDVKALGLNRKGALIVVGLAVDEQDGRLDLVGVAERRGLEVHIRGVPVGALSSAWKPKGVSVQIVCAAARDARTKHIAMREQIRRHKCPVAVPHDGDAFRVDNAE